MVYYYLSPCKHVVTGKDYDVINILHAFVVPSVGHSYLSSNAQCIAAATTLVRRSAAGWQSLTVMIAHSYVGTAAEAGEKVIGFVLGWSSLQHPTMTAVRSPL